MQPALVDLFTSAFPLTCYLVREDSTLAAAKSNKALGKTSCVLTMTDK